MPLQDPALDAGQCSGAIGAFVLEQMAQVFANRVRKRDVRDDAVAKESVHHFFKYISGEPLVRPTWFFDVRIEPLLNKVFIKMSVHEWNNNAGYIFNFCIGLPLYDRSVINIIQ